MHRCIIKLLAAGLLGWSLAVAQSQIEAIRWQVGLGEHKPALLRLDQVRQVLPQEARVAEVRQGPFPAVQVNLPDGKVFYAQRINVGSKEYIPLEDLIISTVEQGYSGEFSGWSSARLRVGIMDLQLSRADPYLAYVYLLGKSVLGRTEYRTPLDPSTPQRCLHIISSSDAPNTVFAILTRKAFETQVSGYEGQSFDISYVQANQQLRFRLIDSELVFAGSLEELGAGTGNAVLVRFGTALSGRGIDFSVVKLVDFSKSTQCR